MSDSPMKSTGMKWLLLGAGGQVGWELERSLMPLGEGVALTRRECDLSDLDQVRDRVASYRPDVIVNAAAYTAVDQAEDEPELARRINAEAMGVLGESARQAGALVVHYSTDYVFDGSSSRAYREDDATAPASVYGQTKLAGEIALRDSGADHLVLRTAWVYGTRGRNFLLTMLRLAQQRDSLNVVNDQFGAPTWARNIADATAHIVHQARHERGEGCFASEVLHLTSGGCTSWHGFAETLLSEAHDMGMVPSITVNPIPSSEFPQRAARPKYSVLDTSRLKTRFGVQLPSWEIPLSACLASLSATRTD
ncbi:dTDP-4-dehydrorhamnose reductase [Halomonas shantousis]